MLHQVYRPNADHVEYYSKLAVIALRDAKAGRVSEAEANRLVKRARDAARVERL